MHEEVTLGLLNFGQGFLSNYPNTFYFSICNLEYCLFCMNIFLINDPFLAISDTYREFSPYANFITANFITAVFQNYY